MECCFKGFEMTVKVGTSGPGKRRKNKAHRNLQLLGPLSHDGSLGFSLRERNLDHSIQALEIFS